MTDQNGGVDRNASDTRGKSDLPNSWDIHIDRSARRDLVAPIVERLKGLPPIREELVARIKKEIQQGVYETPEKMDIAIERLIQDLS